MGTLTGKERLTEGRHAPPLPRRTFRVVGSILVAAGVLVLAWAIVVWRWQDPFTAVYTHIQQERLARQYALRTSQYRPDFREPRNAAAAYRRSLRVGAPVGRLRIRRIGLDMIVVQGTDDATLRKGPGHYVGSALPGEGRLIYVAGHRTTYLAPFSHIDRIRVGDTIVFSLPYGTFEYRVVHDYVVAADDVRVLRNRGREVLRLQACHPRFFATERYIVDARLVAALPVRPPRLLARAGTGSAR
jgi:sortase A